MNEKTESTFKTAFTIAFALATFVCYEVGMVYAYIEMAGFGTIGAVLSAVVTTAMIPTGVGLVIWGFITAALSDGKLTWMAAAAGPLFGLLLCAIPGAVVGVIIGGISELVAGKADVA